MSIRIKSEGALDTVEQAIARYEKIEELLEQPVEFVANALPSSKIDLEAVARLEKLDPVPARRLEEVCKRVAELARKQLRERDIEPTALRVEDLLAQLIARANVRGRRPKESPMDPRAARSLPLFAMPVVLTLLILSNASGLEIGVSLAVLTGAAILAYVLSRTPRN